jgi:hypothetical protein
VGGGVVSASFPARCQTACLDLDQDGLDDDWEDGVLDALRPALVFYPKETLFDDPGNGVVMAARIAPACDDQIRLYIAILYDEDSGRCSVSRHDGDVERVVIALAPSEDDPLVHEIHSTYTAAHEGTAFDSSTIQPTLSLVYDRLTDRLRPLCFVAAGKHGTYASNNSGCVTEDACLLDTCASSVDEAVVIRAWNVGEAEAPRPGPPKIDPWSGERFCGAGRPATAGCPPPFEEKLLRDPLPCD